MEAVKDILDANGYDSVDELEIGDPIEVEAENHLDLTIEKVGEHRVSVGHYYTQQGDLMSDPELVFDTRHDEWTLVRYTQHPGIHQYDETGIDVQDFVDQWSATLHRQGFVDVAHANGGEQ